MTAAPMASNRWRALALCVLLGALFPLGCTRTLGAPTGDDAYEVESNAEAMEDEEEREAWEEINR
jgi:hypothetical protein